MSSPMFNMLGSLEELQTGVSLSQSYDHIDSNTVNPKDQSDGRIVDQEDSVFFQSSLISTSCRCQLMPIKDVSGFLEEPKIMKFPVQELFVGSNDDQGCETSVRKDLWIRNLDEESNDSCGDAEKVVKSYPDSYADDEEGPDVLQEHQNLVKQMKTEIKNSRAGGLPTISEEYETLKMLLDDLKPLEIHLKIEYKDVMAEIHKFYKSYTERMRKLDILNYQTLHAISFLHLKDSEIFTANKKKNGESLPFTLPRSLKSQRIHDDPLHKAIFELHNDLELVYVGQVCLSWEILTWLTAKTQQLMDYDPQEKNNHRSYNRTAEGFQQFQVLLQRFLEDEQFQGHRIQKYVNAKCNIRHLLYVPDIKDDCSKAKKERTDSADAISLEQLLTIIKESKMILRDFVYADKKSKNPVQKGLQEKANNSELLQDILTNLQKKEKRLRDHIRSGYCFVKKLKKHHEWCLDNQLLLTCEVELRLVARVLKLSRLTRDQLLWCRTKLNNISFVGRKVHLEPAFALFPY